MTFIEVLTWLVIELTMLIKKSKISHILKSLGEIKYKKNYQYSPKKPKTTKR